MRKGILSDTCGKIHDRKTKKAISAAVTARFRNEFVNHCIQKVISTEIYNNCVQIILKKFEVMKVTFIVESLWRGYFSGRHKYREEGRRG